ncbi:MAG: SLC13 family permease [Phormidesmis sp.]
MSSVPITLGVVAVALLLFIVEIFPADITAIAIMVALILLKQVTPEQGIEGFSNPATITVMAMFILSAGVARTGALQRASTLLLQWGGKRLSQQIMVLGLIVGPMSALVNNTAIVSVFLPIVEDFCQQHRISPSKLLMPLSFATILGGMITVIGTSTSVLASGLSEDLGLGEFSLFQFALLGAITFAVGMVYLALIAPRLLPNRQIDDRGLSQRYGMKDYVSELVITPRSSLVGQTLRASQLQRRFDVDVLELIRNNAHFPQPLADKTLEAGDILLARGGKQDLLKIRESEGLEILPDVQFGQKSWRSESGTEEGIAEALIISNSNLIGSTLKDIRFRQRYNVTVLAIRRGQELLRDRMGTVSLRFGDLLLVQGPKQSLVGIQTGRNLLLLEQRDIETLRTSKANTALTIGLAVVAAAAFTDYPILVSALAGVIAMIVSGCLKPGELYQAVRWDVIFLLACLIPLGTAMTNSGATQWIADQLVMLSGDMSSYWLLTLLYVLTVLLTAVLSNNASVILLLPVGVQVAQAIGISPLTTIFVITFAASNSFMTPIGYQTNTMVYSAGGYRFIDFLRVGGPLSLIMAVITPPLAIWIYGL